MRIQAYIEGHQLELTITDNRSVMLSVRREPRLRKYVVRIHHLFIHAPTDVITCLARYIVADDRDACQQLNRFIDANDHRVRPDRRLRQTVIRTRGRVYDLRAVFDRLNQEYFGGAVHARITWGRNANRGRQRSSVRLGSFTMEEGLIRIHPGLDQRWVPEHYLQWVVFHEMLHASRPVERINGRHHFHDSSFARAERTFAHYEQATEWERRNLTSLLRI